MIEKVFWSAVSVFLLAYLALLSPQFLEGDDPLPRELCMEPVACGGQGTVPGPYSWCSREQERRPCEYCTGTDQVRLCSPTGCRRCIRPQSPRECGEARKGICTKKSLLLGQVIIYYCKDNGMGAGTRNCTMRDECTGDQ
jgi:hypothetical protein